MNISAVALLLFKKPVESKKFLEYFDYDHSFFKESKETIPVAMVVNLREIDKTGITKFVVGALDEKTGITFGEDAAIKNITLDILNPHSQNIPQESIKDKIVNLSIKQFAKIKSFGEFYSYIENAKKFIDGFEVKYFAHCDKPNECISGRIEGICRKCDIYDGFQIDAINKEMVTV